MVCRALSVTLLSVWDFRSFSWDRDVSFIPAIIQPEKTCFSQLFIREVLVFLRVSGYLVNPLTTFHSYILMFVYMLLLLF